MNFIFPILLIFVFAFGISKCKFFQFENLPKWFTPFLFLTKIAAAFALWAVYTFYYTDLENNDIYKYFNDAKIVHHSFSENKTAFYGLMLGKEDSNTAPYEALLKNWNRNFNNAVPFNENRFMIRLNTSMLFISGGNIHIHTILFCFISFMGVCLLLKTLQLFVSGIKFQITALLFFLPSFLFWTSGALKESLLLLAFGMLLFGFFSLFTKRNWLLVLLFLAGCILLLLLKYFLFLCLVPALFAYSLLHQEKSWKPILLKYAVVNASVLLLIVLVAPLNPKLDFMRLMLKKQKRSVAEAIYMKAGSYSEVPVLDTSVSSLVKYAPVGIWNSLMKPYLWKSRNPMLLLSALENVVFLVFIGLALYYSDWKNTPHKNLFFFLLFFSLQYFALIGLLTPVIGNLVRYRVLVLPLFLFAFLLLVDAQKVKFRIVK